MIKIDGSYGEGGGQILRTTVSLSALSMKPVQIVNIRAGRPKPGLKRQHIAGIELVGQIVNADIKGLEIGSTEIEFIPRERRGGRFHYDVGTAGAISLILQAVLPVAVLSPSRIAFELTGGTDVAWSPPIDYMREVFVPMISKLGPEIKIEQKRRGHYPKGGGRVVCTVEPVTDIQPVTLVDFGELRRVGGISHCVRLPSHIAERQAKIAERLLLDETGGNIEIKRESYPRDKDPHLGPGSGIVLWAVSDSEMRLGADSLGEKRKSAEKVGTEAATKLLRYLTSGMAVDPHLADMLVPYLALSSGESQIGVAEITTHLKTNIWAVRTILGAQMNLEQKNGAGILSVRGVRLVP